jgi:hypothetical protein
MTLALTRRLRLSECRPARVERAFCPSGDLFTRRLDDAPLSMSSLNGGLCKAIKFRGDVRICQAGGAVRS